MPSFSGNLLVIKVETITPGTFVEVKYMDTFSYQDQPGTAAKRFLFNQASPIVGSTQPNESLQFSGVYDATDAGQVRLRLVRRSGATFNVQILPDGTNGWLVPCIRAQHGVTAKASEGGDVDDETFNFNVNGVITTVGTGFDLP